MLNNLFTTFDPCTGKMSMNWMSMISFMIMMPMKFWMKNNNMMNELMMMKDKMNKEIKSITKTNKNTMLMISMMIMILMNNMSSLIPYVFSSSSHLMFSMTMALPMWSSLMMFGWMKKWKKMLIHLVPTGTPIMIMPFMVIIETMSNMMRPISLSVRLTANMIAGHIIMSLLGSKSKMLILMFMLMLTFETAVSMIQSYVFTMLSSMYSSEI